MAYYAGIVTFAGIVGSDKEYEVEADSIEEASDFIIEEARQDLEMLSIDDIGDGDWEVTIGFGGYIGVEETYTVTADDEDEAFDLAFDEASMDLEVEMDEIPEESEEDY